ncbi:class I SAM-dependent methyltransferase [Thermoflavimicrobium daqui]|uniref:class I SAM-dependent methyltransferase n=1 Tax=Thermoflavimicrobium daqui TaxID=2137476 RepID=UPI0023E7D922|nr:class I SAM-dependent methyltransferase [Thermoflavimicrobium daqui]
MHDFLTRSFHFDGRRVLDFGAGTGANCSIFSSENYIGIDPDAKRISYAKKVYPDYTFEVLENNRLTVDDQSMDFILIIAVLHHISSNDISTYISEFKRILKPDGTIIVMEPYLSGNHPIGNQLMRWIDRGPYIRSEQEYLHLFQNHGYTCKVINRFRKCLVYHELFFCAQFPSL